VRRSRHHCRALTAPRLAGALFYELLDVGLDVQVCGSTMKKLGRDGAYPLPGIHRGSMKTLSALTSADEIITF